KWRPGRRNVFPTRRKCKDRSQPSGQGRHQILGARASGTMGLPLLQFQIRPVRLEGIMPMRRWSVIVAALLGWAALGNAAEGEERAVALVNTNLIDGLGNAPVPGQTILIADGRISAIFGSGDQPLPPA